MIQTKQLKSYLIDEKYLFDEQNNGKVIMISGKWGAGKTHFWKNSIEPELSILQNKSKAYVYVSLYGKEDIESIKNEILFKAYESIKNENKTLQRSIAIFSKVIPSISFFGVRFDTNSIESFFTSKKVNEAKDFLLDGGIICFDDFERKSEKIELNDLFGLISQLSQEMKCKIVLILNSDVFEGKDAVVFRNVKEKTVNKFFYFSPSIDELFKSIFDDNKYKPLLPYKDSILYWIKKSDELNARLYIQVLDNCLEWINKKFSPDALKALIYTTIFFSKYHFTLDYKVSNNTKIYVVIDYFLKQGYYEIAYFLKDTASQLFSKTNHMSIKEIIQILMKYINEAKKEDKTQHSEDYKKRQNEEVEKNKALIIDFIKYVYILKVEINKNRPIEASIYLKVNDFVKNGILLSEDSTKA